MAAKKTVGMVATEPDKVTVELEKIILTVVKGELPKAVASLKQAIIDYAKDGNSSYTAAESWMENCWYEVDTVIQNAIDKWVKEHTELTVIFK